MGEDTATAPLDPRDGALAGRYRLGEVVGQGGFARVFRAHDLILGRTVAIKQFSTSIEPRDRGRMRTETLLLASLTHSSLVTLFDAELDADPPYLVMEYIDGPTLRTHLETHGALSSTDAARVASDLAGALSVVHARDIVHRDLKPSNVLMRPSHVDGQTPTATLADFGIASLVDATRVTATGTVVGTAAYLSPEQVRGAAPATSADIYSLGLVLIETLSGRAPYPGSAPVESLVARLTQPPPIPDGIGPAWRQLLTAMTTIAPDSRPSADEVAAEARRIAARPDDASESQATRVLPAAPGTASTALLSATPGRVAPELPTRPDLPTAVTPAPQPAGRDSLSRRSSGDVSSAGEPRRARRTAVLLTIVAALLAAGIAIAWVASANPAPAPAPSFPTLPDPINTHIDELWNEVSP
ncbi:serine/threonine-protein kinase [Microbacterium sp. cx-59]|uniref:serine/threonine-protein kinase n=1 Tax=Microbacterium sp. cx-59 TaxID=2891207 RepID=UPI001E3F6657|nr:serine/threonine-protein kinase [Microbacterium sp. cx-59]MCC4907022.1 serine/threonine protein kinase [Microbacterium sp. cx-59]